MQTALLVVHLMVAASLVTIVLFQQSEGGALGIGGGGGGGGGGGFLTGRGTANLLTRVTAFLAMAFFVTSIGLTILSDRGGAPPAIVDQLDGPAKSAPSVPGSGSAKAPAGPVPAAPGGSGGVLDALKKGDFRLPKVPQGQ